MPLWYRTGAFFLEISTEAAAEANIYVNINIRKYVFVVHVYKYHCG